MTLKMTTLLMDWTDKGCKMTVGGSIAFPCPVCGELIANAEHCCGDKAPKQLKKPRKEKLVIEHNNGGADKIVPSKRGE